jgi:hypothetical protein
LSAVAQQVHTIFSWQDVVKTQLSGKSQKSWS